MGSVQPQRSQVRTPRPSVRAGLDTSAAAERFELIARRSHEAAVAAQQRATAAQQRREAAAARVVELRNERTHNIQRPQEAAARLARAETAAKVARRLALEDLERAAVAHEDAAYAHERVADLADRRSNLDRASLHRREAKRARAARLVADARVSG